MTTSELKEYLGRFNGDSKVGFIIIDLDERMAYPIKRYDLIYDTEDKGIDGPVVVLEVKKAKPLDDIAEEVKNEEEV